MRLPHWVWRDAPFMSTPADLGLCSQCKQDVLGCFRLLGSCGLRPWWHDSLTHIQFMGHILLWAALLAPVPCMRVVLYDHTMEQAMVGSLIGVLHALLWWRTSR